MARGFGAPSRRSGYGIIRDSAALKSAIWPARALPRFWDASCASEPFLRRRSDGLQCGRLRHVAGSVPNRVATFGRSTSLSRPGNGPVANSGLAADRPLRPATHAVGHQQPRRATLNGRIEMHTASTRHFRQTLVREWTDLRTVISGRKAIRMPRRRVRTLRDAAFRGWRGFGKKLTKLLQFRL